MWLVFFCMALALLVLDLGFFNNRDHEIELRESFISSAFYISAGLLFGGWIWWNLGEQKALEYYTGFVVEKTLAMDNIFVIAMIFSYFSIPRLYQHRVLFWGILGVIILRGIMIGFGAALIDSYEWILYIFAAFLIFTGIKMIFSGDDHYDVGNNPILKFMTRHFRITNELHGSHFLVRQKNSETGKAILFITPLLVTLVMIEIADVIFAVDSIPAIFAITTDPYIVYTSNIFAILGLRALYFVLSALISRFVYLKYALSIVLVFIGSKVFVIDFMAMEEFPPMLSLGITVGILAVAMLASLWKTRYEKTAGDR